MSGGNSQWSAGQRYHTGYWMFEDDGTPQTGVRDAMESRGREMCSWG